MRIPHGPEWFESMRRPTEEEPWRVLAGLPCGVDGTDMDLGAVLGDLLGLPTLRVVLFCPEDHALGTPRRMPDIHGGDGFDVLDGRARVLNEHGVDLTRKVLAGARAMLACGLEHDVELAILTDMSASCGSQVISDGCRLVDDRRYRAGVGVATALLLRHGIGVVSQRDHRTLERLRAMLDEAHTADPAAQDHHETPWYREYFGAGG